MFWSSLSMSVKAVSASHIVVPVSRLGVHKGLRWAQPGHYSHSAKPKRKSSTQCYPMLFKHPAQIFHWEWVFCLKTKQTEEEYFWSTWLEQKHSWCDLVWGARKWFEVESYKQWGSAVNTVLGPWNLIYCIIWSFGLAEKDNVTQYVEAWKKERSCSV